MRPDQRRLGSATASSSLPYDRWAGCGAGQPHAGQRDTHTVLRPHQVPGDRRDRPSRRLSGQLAGEGCGEQRDEADARDGPDHCSGAAQRPFGVRDAVVAD
jgi:hypothetical protein